MTKQGKRSSFDFCLWKHLYTHVTVAYVCNATYCVYESSLEILNLMNPELKMI